MADEKELINVRNLRWEDGHYVVGEFNDLGQATSRVVPNKQGEEIRLQFERSQPDIDHYVRAARLNPEFPVPTTIPVEISR